MQRKLKYVTFEFDENTREFSIVRDNIYFTMNKVYTVSFVRFVLSVLAKGFYKKNVKQNKKLVK